MSRLLFPDDDLDEPIDPSFRNIEPGEFSGATKLGQGGESFGVFKVAYSGREYAIKVCLDRGEVRALAKEFEILSTLPANSYFIKAYDKIRFTTEIQGIELPAEGYGLLLELASSSLDELKDLTVEDTLNLAETLLSGIELLHHNGFVHNDLKEGNILVQTGQLGFQFRISDLSYCRKIASNEQIVDDFERILTILRKKLADSNIAIDLHIPDEPSQADLKSAILIIISELKDMNNRYKSG